MEPRRSGWDEWDGWDDMLPAGLEVEARRRGRQGRGQPLQRGIYLMACGEREKHRCRQKGQPDPEAWPATPTGATAKLKVRSRPTMPPTITPGRPRTGLPDKRKRQTRSRTRNGMNKAASWNRNHVKDSGSPGSDCPKLVRPGSGSRVVAFLFTGLD